MGMNDQEKPTALSMMSACVGVQFNLLPFWQVRKIVKFNIIIIVYKHGYFHSNLIFRQVSVLCFFFVWV